MNKTTHVGVGENGELVEVHDPGSTGRQIDQVYAILATDPTGEGIVGFNSPDGWMPMVTSDRQLIEKFAEVAQKMSDVTQKSMVVVEFTGRAVIGSIEPS